MRLKSLTPTDLAEPAVEFVARSTQPPGSPDWCQSGVRHLKKLWPFLEANQSAFQRELQQLREHRAWLVLPSPEAPYGSEDAMMLAELGVTAGVVSERLSNAQRYALEAGELRPPHRPAKLDNCPTYVRAEGGNSATYLAARLKREHSAIHARLAAGEFRSVRAAAMEAGIVTSRPRLSIPLDDLDAAGALLRRRLTPAQLIDLIAALAGEEHA